MATQKTEKEAAKETKKAATKAKNLKNVGSDLVKNHDAELGINSKEMVLEHGQKKTKIFYTERLEIEVIKDMRYHNVGDILTPHKVVAEEYIKKGFAKRVTKE